MEHRFSPSDLGFAHLDDSSRSVESFIPEGTDDYGSTPIDVILPSVTLDILDDHAPDLAQEVRQDMTEDGIDLTDSEAIAEWLVDFGVDQRFSETDGYHEWAESFWPLINAIWPVCVRYEDDTESLASRIDEVAPNVTLVRLDDDSFGFVLSGAGMDFSDKLAAAYMTAGHVPPYTLLCSSWAMHQMRDHAMRDHWKSSLIQASEFFARRSADLERAAQDMDAESV